MDLDRYTFSFPKRLIAQQPVHPRDAAKLLIFDRKKKKTTFASFRELPKFVPENAVLVLNETKVIPARLYVTKPTGGKVEILYLETTGSVIKALANRKLAVGMRLTLTKNHFFIVIKQEGSIYFLKPSFPLKNLGTVFEKYGHTPLPPYIKHTPLSEQRLRTEYQAVFAREKGSVAAPTASLHFTKRLLNDLKKRGVTIAYVTLHVGLGTFAPVTDAQIRSKKLHYEQYIISRHTAKLLNQAKKEGRPIIAVGTTVVRTLESAAQTSRHTRRVGRSASVAALSMTRLSGSTYLFIQEGYRFRIVDGMITNFHVPRSSLLMLVSAFAGREQVLTLYRSAIRKKFRLFSFGDGMLVY